jgi:hypothetical protein
MRFNGVGRLLLLTTRDRNYRLVEFASRAALGDSIASTSTLPFNRLDGDLRADNKQLALPAADGVSVWELDPKIWVARACALAARQLTNDEWDTYLSTFGDRRPLCREAA